MKYIKLMRLKHWIKNILIFLPIVFGHNLLNSEKAFEYFSSFIAFCFIASAVYVINDLMDIDKDRTHPIKKNRPLACGLVNKTEAYVLLFGLIGSCGIILYVSGNFVIEAIFCLVVYLVLNIAYSRWLKEVPIVDVAILSSGFLIRTVYGGVISGIVLSNWLYLTVASMSLFLALGKRRNELNGNDSNSRKVLEYYNIAFLDKFMYLCLSITIVFYALWSMDASMIAQFGQKLLFTVPLVIIICMKYCLAIEMNAKNEKEGDPTDVLFSDKILLGLVLSYAIIIILIIY